MVKKKYGRKDGRRMAERSPQIKKYKGLPSQELMSFEMQFLRECHLVEVLDLQEIVSKSLPSAGIFRPHSREFFEKALGAERSGLGIFTKEGLVAFSLICIPPREHNLGSEVGLEDEEICKAAHLQVVAVHPAFRGNSLQRRMAERHLQVLKDMGYEHVCSTVSPYNPFSLRNFLEQGFVIKALKVKFASRWRYIVYKNLLRPIAIGPEEAAVSPSDIESQVELLESGLLGFGLRGGPNGLLVSYARERGSASAHATETRSERPEAAGHAQSLVKLHRI
jgi:ribosomal protein S18 acetylase RimI-like enzyme